MTIVFDAASSKVGTTAASTMSWTHTVAASSACVVVGIGYGSTASSGLSVTGVTVGGSAATLSGTTKNQVTTRTVRGADLWYHLTGTSGAKVVQATWNVSSQSQTPKGYAVSYAGVGAVSATVAGATGALAAKSVTQSMSDPTGVLVGVCAVSTAIPFTSGAGITLRAQSTGSSNAGVIADRFAAASGNLEWAVTGGAAAWAARTCELTNIVSSWSVTPAKLDATTKVASPTLALGAIGITPSAGSIVTKVNLPVLTLGAISLAPAAGSIVTGVGSPTLELGAPLVNIVPDSAKVVTGVGIPTLTLGSISVTPAKGTIVAGVTSPTLALSAITIAPLDGLIELGLGSPILSGFVVPAAEDNSAPNRKYKQRRYTIPPPPPPLQIEVEMRAMMDVYKEELRKQKASLESEQGRLDTLEMGRRQMEINRQLNRQPKGREGPDDGMVQRMIAKAEKQRQQEIDMANKLKMARVRAAKRKPKAKR